MVQQDRLVVRAIQLCKDMLSYLYPPRAGPAPPGTTDFLLVGDSWMGSAAQRAFRELLEPRGFRVRAFTASGQKLSLLAALVQSDRTLDAWGVQNASHVLLLSGINDLRGMPLDHYIRSGNANGGTGNTDDQNITTARLLPQALFGDCYLIVLRALWHANPRLKIVSFAYDLLCRPNFKGHEQSPGPGLACAPRELPACYNAIQASLQATQTDLAANLLARAATRDTIGGRGYSHLRCGRDFTPARKFRNVLAAAHAAGGSWSVVNLQGSFQAAGNVPGAAVGAPNLHAFSPERFFGSREGMKHEVDCLHPTVPGMRVLAKALVERYELRR